MEFADILCALDPDRPCGADLEYDADFLLLQQAATGKGEQQFGDTIIPAAAPDWREVEKRVHSLLERTRDLRIFSYLAQAWTETRGLPGYADGVTLVAEALERYWDGVHPLLEAEGEHDPLPRVNALASLGDVQGCARSARSALVLDGVHGHLSLRDAEAVLDGSRAESGAYPGGRGRLVETLRQAGARQSPELLAVCRAQAALERIEQTVRGQLGSEWAPDYRGILRTLGCVAQHVNEGAAAAASEANALPPGESGSAAASDTLAAPAIPSAAAAPPAALRWQSAAIQSREDAAAMLDKVCAYFEVHEPSHPAPYLIRRVRELIPMNFHEIMRNLAPQGLGQFEAWLSSPGRD
jgi:type VI secretion system protein ImpA